MSDSGSASGSDDEGPGLTLDPRFPGRVALLRPEVTDPDEGDVFEFASFKGALGFNDSGAAPHLEPLVADCKRAFTATSVQTGEESSGGLGVSSGDTYWVPAAVAEGSDDKSDVRCGLEALAREIFEFHCLRLGLDAKHDYDPLTSGAEWWTQCIESDAEIGLHWDKDFSFEEQSGMDLFPHLATVTYLTSGGSESQQAPTIVLEHTPTGMNEEDDEDEDEEEEDTDVKSPYASGPQGVQRAWLSCAQPGKHMCFNGSHLHGAFQPLHECFAPAPLTATSSKKDKEAAPAAKRQKISASKESKAATAEPPSSPLRITFLVNLWFNWKPLGCDPLPDEVVNAMTIPADAKAFAAFAFGQPVEQETHPLQWPGSSSNGEPSSTDDLAMLRRRFEQRGQGHVLEMPLGKGMEADDDVDDDSEESAPGAEGEGNGKVSEKELPWRLPFGASAAIKWSAKGPTARVYLDPDADSDSEEDSEEGSDDDEEEDDEDEEEMSKDEQKLRLIQALIDMASLSGRQLARAAANSQALRDGDVGDLTPEDVEECETAALAALREKSMAKADTAADYCSEDGGKGGDQSGDDEEEGDAGGDTPSDGAGSGFEIVD